MEPFQRVLIDVGMGLEGAEGVDRQHRVEHRLEPERLTNPSSIMGEPLERMAVLNPARAGPPARREPRGTARGRDRGPSAARATRASRERGFRGQIERVAGDLPEVGVAFLERSQPGVLELLVAPELGQRGSAILRRSGQRAAAEAKSTGCRRRRRRRPECPQRARRASTRLQRLGELVLQCRRSAAEASRFRLGLKQFRRRGRGRRADGARPS